MEYYYGKVVYKGIAVGKVVEFKKENKKIQKAFITDVKDEVKKFEKARNIVKLQLQQIYKNVLKNVGKEEAYIFEIHIMMLEDEDYNDSIKNIIINQHANADYAVSVTMQKFLQTFELMDDDYMKERAIDIKDISQKIISVLENRKEKNGKLLEPAIIVADDLMPSEVIKLDKKNVLAFITRKGSVNSHTAIIAKTIGIPSLVKVKDVPEGILGKLAIVDGFNETFIVEPDKKALDTAKKSIYMNGKEAYNTFIGKETKTKNGKKISLYANCNFIEDIISANKNDAEGIGLFRTEFIYMKADSFPEKQTQYNIYKDIFEVFGKEKRIIIRTVDIGADKKVNYFDFDNEQNPALGIRGIRMGIKKEQILKTQLRALYEVSTFGKLAIMIPMVTSVWEVKRVKQFIDDVKRELINENVPFADVEFGIMIETPAAVMISEELAKEVDFFSIGTNDLTQYTLAMDRQNSNLDDFYNVHHEAVLRMIKLTISNAHKAGIWVGICGDLASDTELTKDFIDMGIDELSVPADMILPLRKKIMEL